VQPVDFKATEFLSFETRHAGPEWGKTVALVKNMLSNDPDQRPTAQEVVKILEEIPKKQK
jgi:hypothetical protein